jgi:hypothetical protein
MEVKEKDQSLDKRFESERIKWRDTIDEYSKQLADIRKLGELQVHIFSSLGFIADYRRSLSNLSIKKMYKIRETRMNVLNTISQSQERFVAKEKEYFIEGSIKEDLFKTEVINNHVEFLNDIYDILNRMLYSVKNRIDMEGYA